MTVEAELTIDVAIIDSNLLSQASANLFVIGFLKTVSVF